MEVKIKKASVAPKVAEEATPEPVAEVIIGESIEKQKFRYLIEAYKAQNPAKYELKKAELERKLNNIK
jgi:hypothetical protein